MAEKEKDHWDKFDITFRSIILGLIPIVIALAADNVAQSLKRGELIQSLVESLSKSDNKRDIALIALDEAIPPRQKCELLWLWRCHNNLENDPVVQIATVMINTSLDEALEKKQSPKELSVAKKIISSTRRGDPNYYRDEFESRYKKLEESAQSVARSNLEGKPTTEEEISKQANISQTLAVIQPSSQQPTVDELKGIRLVFIQYKSKRDLAENIQKDLQRMGISAPGIEKVDGITQNDIRFAASADRETAERLRAYLQKNQSISFDKLIDLAQSKYRVPLGQFEIWLK